MGQGMPASHASSFFGQKRYRPTRAKMGGGGCLCCFQWGPTSLPAATLTDFSQAERSNLLFMFPFNRGMKRLTPQVICELIKEEHVEAVF